MLVIISVIAIVAFAVLGLVFAVMKATVISTISVKSIRVSEENGTVLLVEVDGSMWAPPVAVTLYENGRQVASSSVDVPGVAKLRLTDSKHSITGSRNYTLHLHIPYLFDRDTEVHIKGAVPEIKCVDRVVVLGSKEPLLKSILLNISNNGDAPLYICTDCSPQINVYVNGESATVVNIAPTTAIMPGESRVVEVELMPIPDKPANITIAIGPRIVCGY